MAQCPCLNEIDDEDISSHLNNHFVCIICGHMFELNLEQVNYFCNNTSSSAYSNCPYYKSFFKDS